MKEVRQNRDGGARVGAGGTVLPLDGVVSPRPSQFWIPRRIQTLGHQCRHRGSDSNRAEHGEKITRTK